MTPTSSASRPPREVVRLGRALAALALVTYLVTAGGSLTSSDAVVSFEVTRNIVDHGTVAIPETVLGWEAQRGRDGRFYSPFGVAQALLHVPVYLAAKGLVAATGMSIGKPDTLPKAVVAVSQTVVVATLVWLTFHACVAIVRVPAHAATMATLTLAFGSAFWPYSKFGFNQPLAALVVLAAVYDAVLGLAGERRRLWRAGLWVGLAMHVRHELVLIAIPLCLWMVWQQQSWPGARAALQRFVPGIAAGVAAWLSFNAWRYGNPLDPGYLNDETVKFFSSVGEGFAGLLISPGGSIFLYSPVALAGAVGLVVWLRRRRTDGVAWLLAGIVATILLFYASIGSWSAGRSYGARYLLPVLPLLVLGFAWWLDRLTTRTARRFFTVVFVAGVLVQIPGVLVDYSKVSQDHRRFTGPEREWTFAASPWVLNARALGTALPQNLAYLSGAEPRPVVIAPTDALDRGFAQRFSFSLDLWWAYLFYLGAYPLAGVWVILATLITAWVLAARHCLGRYRAATATSAGVP